jgi:hypothetical protein
VTDLAAELGPDILEMINDLGKTVTFTTSTLTGNPALGTVVESAVVSYVVKVGGPFEFTQRMINGDTVKASDLRLILPAEDLEFTPTLAMKVVIDSITYRVTRVIPYVASEDVVAYDIGARR